MVVEPGERTTKTVCYTCSCDCDVLASVKDRKVVKLQDNPNHPTNRGDLCPRGLSGTKLYDEALNSSYILPWAANRRFSAAYPMRYL